MIKCLPATNFIAILFYNLTIGLDEISTKNFYNENNVPPAQLQKTPLNRKGILAAVPIC